MALDLGDPGGDVLHEGRVALVGEEVEVEEAQRPARVFL